MKGSGKPKKLNMKLVPQHKRLAMTGDKSIGWQPGAKKGPPKGK